MLSEILSESEKNELSRLENIIETGKKSFVEVGEALVIVREQELYRAEHGTFEDYCVMRWKFTVRHAQRLMQQAGVFHELSLPPKEGDTCVASEKTPIETPKTGRQLNALATAPHGQRAAVMKKAVETAPKDKSGKPKVTAKHIEKIVKEAAQPIEVKPIEPENPATDWEQLNQRVKAHLSTIRAEANALAKTLGRQKIKGEADFSQPFTWYLKPDHVDQFHVACRSVEDALPAGPKKGNPGYHCAATLKAEKAGAKFGGK